LPLLLESRHNRLAFADDDDGGGGGGGATTSGGGGGGGGATGRERENAAAEALLATREACFAYAPYSHSPAGLALTTSSGGVYAGRSVESAAYNPSMSPLHVALVAATCGERYSEDGGGGGGGDGGWGVTSATLAEVDGAAVSYEGWCRLMLGVIAPGVALTVVKLKREDVAA
jgi:cytidine deaminase